MEKTIRFNDIETEFDFVVMIDEILYLKKRPNNTDRTLVYLRSGEILETDTSMNTIEARINAASKD